MRAPYFQNTFGRHIKIGCLSLYGDYIGLYKGNQNWKRLSHPPRICSPMFGDHYDTLNPTWGYFEGLFGLLLYFWGPGKH